MRLEKYIIESVSRYCHIYKSKGNKWWIELADKEYGGRSDATTYGPFKSEDDAEKELQHHSNPGSLSFDRSGKAPVPKKSPNGRPIQKPSSQRRRGYYL